MRKTILLVLVLLAGCTAGMELPPLSPSHPASPDAAEAPLRVPETLQLPNETAAATSDGESRKESTAPDAHQGHGGGDVHH